MEALLLAVIIGIPLAWHVALTAFAYWDAGRVGMNRRKWALVVFAVPLFGFFAYLFERSELFYDPEDDPYRGHEINIHPSRKDDVRPNDPRDDDE